MRRLVATCFLSAAVLLAGCLPAGRSAEPLPPAAPPQDAGVHEPSTSTAPAAVPSTAAPAGSVTAPPTAGPSGSPSAPPTSGVAVPTPVPSTPDVTDPAGAASTEAELLPALPLWGRPGLHLTLEQAGRGVAFAYAPVDMLGTTLQPVRLRQGTAYFRVDGDAVYLHGVHTTREGYSALPEPALLHRLPLRVGDTWSIEFPGMVGDRYTYAVEGIEPVGTPGGEQLAARIVVTGSHGHDGTEWWVPGYGLVSYADRYQSWMAERELALEPRAPGAIGRPAPGMQAILWDDGHNYWITTADGEQELFRVSDSYWRSWFGWAEAGEYDLLTHTLFPGSHGVFRFSAFRYDPAAGQFRQLDWISSAGTSPWAVGDGGWGPGGTFTVHDFTGYPTRRYTYRFDGEAMRSDPALEQEIRARSPEAFVRRFFDAPPLGAADMLAMFRDPATGERAVQVMQELYPHGPIGLATITPVEGSPLAFLIEDRGTRLLVEVDEGPTDFQITRFERLE